MIVQTSRSLHKVITWGGIPRVFFVPIVLLAVTAIVVFQTPRAVLPVMALYLILMAIVKIDPKIVSIVRENNKYKDVYLPD